MGGGRGEKVQNKNKKLHEEVAMNRSCGRGYRIKKLRHQKKNTILKKRKETKEARKRRIIAIKRQDTNCKNCVKTVKARIKSKKEKKKNLSKLKKQEEISIKQGRKG